MKPSVTFGSKLGRGEEGERTAHSMLILLHFGRCCGYPSVKACSLRQQHQTEGKELSLKECAPRRLRALILQLLWHELPQPLPPLPQATNVLLETIFRNDSLSVYGKADREGLIRIASLLQAGASKTMKTNLANAIRVLKQSCADCGMRADSRCSRCHQTLYCSRACQKHHWLHHKSKCVQHHDVNTKGAVCKPCGMD